ncbi:MAG: hypothetical protein P8P36_04450 [Akkermansiaceae bacterium]|nr:hypothetical protein [Akkermansiaceae bacterium]
MRFFFIILTIPTLLLCSCSEPKQVESSAPAESPSSSNVQDVTPEEALFRVIESSAEMGDWAKCETSCRSYLDAKYTKRAAQVSYLFAVSFDKRNMNEDALFYYGKVYNRYRGFIVISAPSVQRILEIMWERDMKAGQQVGEGDQVARIEMDDRKACYQNIGLPYINETRNIREKNPDITDEEKALWDSVAALVKKHQASLLIKPMKQAPEEAAEAKAPAPPNR